MIRITDITLSCLDDCDASPQQLKRLCELLLTIGVDYIELSISAYKKIGFLPPNGKYILKIKNPSEISQFSRFDKFSCRHSGYAVPSAVISEIQANDIREINSLNQYHSLENVRIIGLDDLLSHDYIFAFNALKNNISGHIELCPEDKYYCATAIAVEWIMQGGNYIAASFAGIGSKAAIEEVLMSLRLEKRHKPNVTFSALPELRELFEEITGTKISKHKAVLGENIFDVEAGIHVDGISKDPKIYEPFSPELVGNQRRLIIGKHSGRAAIMLKLKELNLDNKKADIPKLLLAVQNKSIENHSSLSDHEFEELYSSIISDKGGEV